MAADGTAKQTWDSERKQASVHKTSVKCSTSYAFTILTKPDTRGIHVALWTWASQKQFNTIHFVTDPRMCNRTNRKLLTFPFTGFPVTFLVILLLNLHVEVSDVNTMVDCKFNAIISVTWQPYKIYSINEKVKAR